MKGSFWFAWFPVWCSDVKKWKWGQIVYRELHHHDLLGPWYDYRMFRNK